MSRAEILSAIEHELERQSQPLRFEVTHVWRESSELWSLFVRSSEDGPGGIDESLEGAAAWWPGQPPGSADVLAVIPSSSQIVLRFVQGTAPSVADKLRIYPPPFLAALLNSWRDVAWSNECLGWHDRTRELQWTTRPAAAVPGGCGLRPGQERAFRLPRFERSYLWGPPGTGKTHALGFLIGAYLRRFQGSRVLLLSTTNIAVDLAITSVDRALTRLDERSGLTDSPSELRRACQRFGNHFVAKEYEGRRHLIPTQDGQLLARLAHLEASRPDKELVQAYAQWTRDVEALRAQLRQRNALVLQKARVAAMTACFAAFAMQDLRVFAPFDLVVFDESSQVSQAYALALAPLGKAVLFAGDPQQLGPIVQSNHPSALRWIGQSMFDEMVDGSENVVFLDEQSRMAQPICDLVSRLFYRGRLRVAKDALSDPDWRRKREIERVGERLVGQRQVHDVAQEAFWSRQHNGPIRPESADAVAEIVEKLAVTTPVKDILVVTPFRGQRSLIRDRLKRVGLKDVDVSTVHRAQGGERHTVIFDPVHGSSPFLQSDEAKRLINVALSRAMARVVVLLSPGDRENELLRRIAVVITSDSHRVRSEPIASHLTRPDFPRCLIDRVIRIPGRPDIVGRVVRETTTEFVVEDLHDGRERTIRVDALRRAHGVMLSTDSRNLQNGSIE